MLRGKADIRTNDDINAIISRYYDSILNYCRYHLYNNADAEECAQEVFITYITKVKKTKINNPRAWLYRTTDNLLNRYIRKIEKENHVFVPLPERDETKIPLYDLTLDQLLENEVDVDSKVEKVLSKLDEDEAKLYALHFKEKHSLKELTAIYHLSIPAIKNRIYRLRLHIKKISAQILEDETEKSPK